MKNNCKKHPACQLLFRESGKFRLKNVYRVRLGRREGQTIWTVDGWKVVREIYPAFIMGGNDQRYRFNPEGDVWIDNRIGVEELNYTIAHELIERKLMREKGWSYDRAHAAGLALEKEMRDRDQRLAREHALKVGLKVKRIYRQLYKRLGDVTVWLVDGPRVRQYFDGDYTFAGHGYKYPFIPKNEIWLDSAMSCEQAYFALKHERDERALMAKRTRYEFAYPAALAGELDERDRQSRLAERHEKRLKKVSFGVRERGVKVKS